jgi:hypothetical protein
MVFEYDFPPSDAIRELGDIVPGSHFLVDGKQIMIDKQEIECHFEVGYTKIGMIVAIAYFRLSPGLPTYFDTADAIQHTEAITLEGRSRYWDSLNVKVEGLIALRIWSEFLTHSYKISYYAKRFEITADEAPTPTSFHFSIANFPRIQPRKSHTTETLEAERQSVTHERTPILQVPIANTTLATIEQMRDPEDLTYPLEPTCRLSIRQESIPPAWTAEQVADCVCCFLSLAMGCDIQWINWEIPTGMESRIQPRKVWVSRKIRQGRFYGYVLDTRPLYGGVLRTIQDFLAQSLISLFRKRYDEIAEYTKLLMLYIDFANVDSGSETMQGRLLTTLAEELYYTWERIEKIEKASDRLTWKPEMSRLIESLEESVRQKGTIILEQRETETETEFKQRLRRLEGRIAPILRNHVNEKTFEAGLCRLFGHYHYRVEMTDQSGLYMNIKAFVESRNSLVHSGCLAHKNPESEKAKLVNLGSYEEHAAQYEYENIIMMLPMMFAAIMGYRGQYINRIGWGERGGIGQSWIFPVFDESHPNSMTDEIE